MKYFYGIIAIVLIAAVTLAALWPAQVADANKGSPFFVGVSFCGNTASEGKLLIDRVKNYTNLFVLQSLPIARNESAVYETLDYAVANGLYIIVNLSTYNRTYWPMQFPIFLNAQARWGDKFLGAYYGDEPGGMQLDYNWTKFFVKYGNMLNDTTQPTLLNEMFDKFVDGKHAGTNPTEYYLEAKNYHYLFSLDPGYLDLISSGIKKFVSDYDLYWFDYQAGYDTVFAQFGANRSYIQDIDLLRGAARLQNKDWGAILTWKYTQPPYLDTGDEIYRQMTTAYNSGAKYVILFDYPYNDTRNPYGVLQDEHFDALERFYSDVRTTSNMRTIPYENVADSVLVLPANYGWGMRWQDDTIWGFWGPDAKSPQIWRTSRNLLSQYGYHLDIVYDDPAFPVVGKYAQVYLWNQTG